MALETSLAPEELLNHTQRIELQQGRVRKAERWGPRTLDLDIMLFGNEVINTERLTVPHYDMENRGFMLWPLFEIAPDLHFPDGLALRAVLDEISGVKTLSSGPHYIEVVPEGADKNGPCTRCAKRSACPARRSWSSATAKTTSKC